MNESTGSRKIKLRLPSLRRQIQLGQGASKSPRAPLNTKQRSLIQMKKLSSDLGIMR